MHQHCGQSLVAKREDYMNVGKVRKLLLLLCISVCCLAESTRPQTERQTFSGSSTNESYGDHTPLAIQALQSYYDLQTGLYKTTGWWNSANAITVLADYSRSVSSHGYDFVFSNTLSAAEKKFPGFINEYYDDEGWWALAWIDVYRHTGDSRYLEAAEFIFRDMSYGWDDTCSGGIWWSKKRNYKNAIANELFLSVAAELAEEVPSLRERGDYRTWAEREWKWFARSGMINKSHLVNDGLDVNCENNGRTIWTYNQGVILGGLAALSKFDRSPSVLHQANEIAKASISTLIDAHGILHENCDPSCGADGTQFKGIFVRNLVALNKAQHGVASYKEFILANARSIWTQVQPPDYHLGESWAAPFGNANASTQSSALDTLVGAASIQKSP